MDSSELLAQVNAGVGAVAVANGFTGHSREALGGKLFARWLRNAGWKTERIEMVWRIKGPRELIVSFDVELPVDSETSILLDGQGVAHLAAGDPSYRLPGSIMGALGGEGFVRGVVKDVEEQIGWFDRLYGTPEKCIERLKNPGGRNGCRAGFPPAMEHLKRAGAQPHPTDAGPGK
jgi:hypothetical protein